MSAFSPGTRVLASWLGGAFQPATVIEANSVTGLVRVAFEDGRETWMSGMNVKLAPPEAPKAAAPAMQPFAPLPAAPIAQSASAQPVQPQGGFAPVAPMGPGGYAPSGPPQGGAPQGAPAPGSFVPAGPPTRPGQS